MPSFSPERLRAYWQAFRLMLRQQIFAQVVGLLLRTAGLALFTAVHGLHF